jgi:hypothetical protein
MCYQSPKNGTSATMWEIFVISRLDLIRMVFISHGSLILSHSARLYIGTSSLYKNIST